MDNLVASTPTPYAGLHVHSSDIFPLVCARCQRRFTGLDDFIARTTPVFQSSGLMEREDQDNSSFVLLLRNCLCGTSLALRCQDRRDKTPLGQLRRRRYDTLVGLLAEVGVDADQAREQVRRLLHELT